jgi:hypothetical protein
MLVPLVTLLVTDPMSTSDGFSGNRQLWRLRRFLVRSCSTEHSASSNPLCSDVLLPTPLRVFFCIDDKVFFLMLSMSLLFDM